MPDLIDAGGDGNVMFDNIRLYSSKCTGLCRKYGPTADLDEDCDVDINDMDRLVERMALGGCTPAQPYH